MVIESFGAVKTDMGVAGPLMRRCWFLNSHWFFCLDLVVSFGFTIVDYIV